LLLNAYRDKIDALDFEELEGYFLSKNPITWGLGYAEGFVSGVPGYYFYVTKNNVEIDLNVQ